MKRKITLMKLLISGLTTISVLIIFFTSCAKEWDVLIKKRQFYYGNKTGYQMIIVSFNAGFDSTYVIPSGKSIDFVKDITRKGTFNEFMIYDADSLLILFGDSNYQFYTRDSISERNPIFLKNYEYEEPDTQSSYYVNHRFVFEFTSDDVDNAHPINTIP